MRAALLFAAISVPADAAYARDFPTGPIRAVIPYGVGGSADVLARIIAPGISTNLGQSLVIDNRGGGAGLPAITLVAKAQPDGYRTNECSGIPGEFSARLRSVFGLEFEDSQAAAQAAEEVMHSGMFVFTAIERIVFGQPAATALRAEAERLQAKRIFIIASGTMNRTTDEVTKVRDALGNRCAGLYDRVPSHTPRDAVLEAVREARAVDTDLIVSFGGGSVTDAGKLMQLCLQHGITDYEGFDAFHVVVKPDGTRIVPEFDGPKVRQIAIPTTLSGGEFQPQGGATDNRNKVKHSYRHPLHIPRVIILDPAPTVHTPLATWLSTGVRAVDHATEAICSGLSNPASDASFLHALRLLGQGLLRIKRAPDDLEARLDCQLAVWLAMTGRQGGIQMGASHAIGHVLGGSCDVPHGYTSCVMLAPVLRYNRSVNLARQRLVAEAIRHPGEEAADVIAAFVADLGLPGRLADVGVKCEQFGMIADHAMHESWIHTNPRKITSAGQVLEILEAAA